MWFPLPTVKLTLALVIDGNDSRDKNFFDEAEEFNIGQNSIRCTQKCALVVFVFIEINIIAAQQYLREGGLTVTTSLSRIKAQLEAYLELPL